MKRVIISGVDVTEDASETNRRCPLDNGAIIRYPWWDDKEENGGAVIGNYLLCVSCDWYEMQ